MKKKLGLVGGALALVCMSAAAYADSVPDPNYGSIVMLSKEETGIPGYYHQKYVYDHFECLGAVPVDYYGPEIDPTNVEVLKAERKMCASNFWGRDGGGSEGGGGDD